VLKTSHSAQHQLEVYHQLLKQRKKIKKAELKHYTTKISALLSQITNPKTVIKTYHLLGAAHHTKKRYRAAIQYYTQGLAIAREHSLVEQKAEMFYLMGRTYSGQKKYSKAVRYFHKTLTISRQIKSSRLENYTLRGLSATFRSASQLDSAKRYYQQELVLIRALKKHKREVSILGWLGIVCRDQGKYPEAIEWTRKSLQVAQKYNYPDRAATTYNNLGMIYKRIGAYAKALEWYYKALTYHEKHQHLNKLAIVCNNMGVVNKLRGKHDEALRFYLKGMQARKQTSNIKGLAKCYNNIGNIYLHQKQYDQALKYHLMGLKLKQQIGDIRSVAVSYMNLGDVYVKQKQYDQALNYFQKSIDISEKYKDNWLVAHPLNAMGHTYSALGKHDTAAKYLNKALKNALKMGDPAVISMVANEFATVQATLGNYAKAYEYHQLFKQMADSLSSKQSTEKITRLQAEYEFKQEKDSLYKANLAQAAQIEKEALTIRFQYQLNVLGAVVLALVLGVLLFIYIGRQRYKKLNAQLVQQKSDLQIKSEELLQSKEEIATQRDILAHKNTELSHYQYRIGKSFRAAQIIQDSLLSSRDSLHTYFSEHFVIYQPKDVVSGDFFWVAKVDKQVLLIAADCTGHGVPGAFMTLIGSKLLDTIIKVNKVTEPVQVLNQLNQEVQTSLTPSSATSENKIEIVAGMEAVVLCITPDSQDTYQVDFAGAKSSLLYFDVQQQTIHEVRGSRKSVGGFQSRRKKYEPHHLHLAKGSVLYMGSDGVKDQHNLQRRRFGQEALNKLLSQYVHLPLQEQKQCIKNTLADYMEGTEQRDDILWMGVKL
jgi:serine phosphatase RsbU (regulator of sigma subunit)/tetratricopeptide (TPR) repeat protein